MYKANDRVRILSFSNNDWPRNSKDFAGGIMTIDYKTGGNAYIMKNDKGLYKWTEDMFSHKVVDADD